MEEHILDSVSVEDIFSTKATKLITPIITECSEITSNSSILNEPTSISETIESISSTPHVEVNPSITVEYLNSFKEGLIGEMKSLLESTKKKSSLGKSGGTILTYDDIRNKLHEKEIQFIKFS